MNVAQRAIPLFVQQLGKPQTNRRELVKQEDGKHLNSHERQHASKDLIQGDMRRAHTLKVERCHRDWRAQESRLKIQRQSEAAAG